jgi:hypothetical protein
VDPLLREIQQLRQRLGLQPRVFSHEEKFGPAAFDERREVPDLASSLLPSTFACPCADCLGGSFVVLLLSALLLLMLRCVC